jgi:hypothetical protein
MGYPTDRHIKEFASGQTVAEIKSNRSDRMDILFASGESLRLTVINEFRERRILVTPFAADGSIKQSTDIIKPKTND